MNIRYFGPINGHDVKNIARILRDIKDMKGPKILHLHTIKGKGFEPAEKAPGIWHAPGKFDPETGERFTADTHNLPPLYQDVFGSHFLRWYGQRRDATFLQHLFVIHATCLRQCHS